MANPLRVAVVGSREYPNLQQVIDFVNTLPDGTTVVSGGARGVDITAQRAAEARGLPVQIFLPRFQRENTPYSPFHYFDRNTEIVVNSDCVIAFPWGKASGTRDTMEKAIQRKHRVQTFQPDEEATWEIAQAHFAKAAS